jgi:hypothetical protein
MERRKHFVTQIREVLGEFFLFECPDQLTDSGHHVRIAGRTAQIDAESGLFLKDLTARNNSQQCLHVFVNETLQIEEALVGRLVSGV